MLRYIVSHIFIYVLDNLENIDSWVPIHFSERVGLIGLDWVHRWFGFGLQGLNQNLGSLSFEIKGSFHD